MFAAFKWTGLIKNSSHQSTSNTGDPDSHAIYLYSHLLKERYKPKQSILLQPTPAPLHEYVTTLMTIYMYVTLSFTLNGEGLQWSPCQLYYACSQPLLTHPVREISAMPTTNDPA